MLNTKKKPLYREKGIPLSGSEKFLSGFAYAAMALLSLIAILPCLHVISKAVSNGPDVTAGNVYFWPVGFQLETVKYVLTQTSFFTALKNSLIVTGAGTLLSLFTTITTAYPLSKPGFKGRRVVSLLYVISMVFFGGMIPAYMVVRSLGLLDTYAACILPFAIVQFNTPRLKAHIREHRDEIRPFYGPFSWLIREKAAEWGDVPRGEVCLFESPAAGEYRLNVTRILDVDGTNAEDLTRAELEGLRQAHQVFGFLKKYAPGFENARFLDTAATIGIRETRHVDGLYRLTVDDVRACRVPDDSIAVMATNMDTHNKNDPGGTYYTLENGPFFGVPYRCLIPRGISNLLVAGRSISADAMAGSAIRMIPCCLVFGQAAGTAAAMAASGACDPSRVDAQALRSLLLQQGAYLGQ